MLRKIILLLIITCLTFFGYAQKSKRKAPAKAPNSSYFFMTVNGEEEPEIRYCPGDTLIFDFDIRNPEITVDSLKWKWYDDFNSSYIESVKPYKLVSNPSIDDSGVTGYIYLFLDYYVDTVRFIETLQMKITFDFIRTILDTTVCRGRDITVINSFGETFEFEDVQTFKETPWDTLQSVSGCDSLVRWLITVDDYIREVYHISSCDSVVWGDSIRYKPVWDEAIKNYNDSIVRFFPASDPELSCDTMRMLKITFIYPDKEKIIINFKQEEFCANDDMEGTFELETNFTAFNWKIFLDKNKTRDTTFTDFNKTLSITKPGYYEVWAYIDTSLYDTLTDLRIANCSIFADIEVEDCPLIIPNVFTPNGDGINDVLGIKKLNIERDNELTIHDRWGKAVFKQKNYKCLFKGGKYYNIEEAFKGELKSGAQLPDGLYYYSFVYDAIPKKKTYTGTITIIR